MSRAATDWAWSVQGVSSSEKLTLLALADRADEYHQCFPSIARLAVDTGLNRKTIMACIQRLMKAGLMADTGMRRGLSGQVRVYQLGVNALPESVLENPARVPDSGQSQNRDSPKIGTVPNLPAKSPKNGTGNSPKNGTQNQSLEPVSNQEREQARAAVPAAGHVLPSAGQLDDPVPMTLDWQPDQQRLVTLARMVGLPPGAFTSELIGHFKIYFEASGRVQSDARWHRDLISWARREQGMGAKRHAANAAGCSKCGKHIDDCACWAENLHEDIF
ncbi:MAG: hypothetical protein GX665_05260 [Gammaproteobacteria bacterium]|nr:hypothetical protein [Gammaproteobacteria bacterium]